MSESFADEHSSLPVTTRDEIFRGRVLTVVRDHFDYNGVEISREYVIHPGAVAIVAMDENERVLAIKQYRHPIRSRDWEIPAGLRDVADEPLLLAAQRELAEEADLEADDWRILADVTASPGGSSERVRIYLARGLRATAEPFPREEEEADIELRWLPLAEIVEAVLAGAVENSMLAVGVLATAAAKSSNWSTLRRDAAS
jgi:8-oxo-dGDP phosphatase